MKYKAIVYPDQWQDQFPMILKLGVPIGKTWKLVRNAKSYRQLNQKIWESVLTNPPGDSDTQVWELLALGRHCSHPYTNQQNKFIYTF